jgi:hypothetical protein
MDRQLRRLGEAGVEITWVDAAPADTLAERLAAAVRDDTAAVLASSVLFESSTIVPHLAAVAAAARRRGAQVLIDAYHAWHVVPFTLAELGGDEVFVVAGGYKYAQWGEGVCFLRVPPGGARCGTVHRLVRRLRRARGAARCAPGAPATRPTAPARSPAAPSIPPASTGPPRSPASPRTPASTCRGCARCR